MNDFKITIVGLGLIGGSIALALKEKGYSNIHAIDENKETLKNAIKKGIIKESDYNPLKDSKVIILCVYPEIAVDFLNKEKDNLNSNSVITDVSGVKEKLSKKIKEIIPNTCLYIPGHPMAGREKSGFKYADKELFRNANYLIIKPEKSDSRFEIIKNIIRDLEAKVIFTTIKEHDKMIALTSQIPHLLSAMLMDLDDYDETKKFVGNSFDEMTRISLFNEKLWSELFILNNDNLINFLKKINGNIDFFIKSLENKDKKTMEEKLKEIRHKREEYLKA